LNALDTRHWRGVGVSGVVALQTHRSNKIARRPGDAGLAGRSRRLGASQRDWNVASRTQMTDARAGGNDLDFRCAGGAHDQGGD